MRLPYWLLTGVCIGLGFLSKYTNAMELLCILLAMLSLPRWRRELRRPGFYLMLVVAVVLGSPPVFWNASHAWITLNHLHDRGRLGTAFDQPFKEFFNFLGAHLGVYSPLIFCGLVVAIFWGWRVAFPRRTAPGALEPAAEKARFLLAFSLPLIVMYTLLAFKTAGEPNWTAPGFVSLSVLAVALWHVRAQTSRPAAAFCVAALALALVLSSLVVDTDTGHAVAGAVGIPWAYAKDPTSRLLGWRSTARSVADFRREEERDLGNPVFLIANRYQLAAELNFYLPDRPVQTPDAPPVYMPESQNLENQFSFWPGYDTVVAPPRAANAPLPTNAQDEFKDIGTSPFVGHSALYVTDDERHRQLPDSVESAFEECSLVAQYEIQRRGQHLSQIRIYACFNYRGLDL